MGYEINELTQKQETFCIKYFECGNATEAARFAGYSVKTATAIGAENLTKPDIQNRLARLRQKVEDDSCAGIVEIKQILTSMIRATFAEFWDKPLTAYNIDHPAIASITRREFKYGKGDAVTISTTVTLADKIKAIKQYCVICGFNAPEVNVNFNLDIDPRELSDEQLAAIIIPGYKSLTSGNRAVEEKGGP